MSSRVRRRTVRRVARHEGIDPNLFLALVNQESGRQKHVVSPAGAIGPTQLMPGTAQGLGVDPNRPIQNLQGGAHYLHELLNEFGGNRTKALAAYNAGPGAVQKYGGVPPYAETQNYVRSILAAAGQPPAPGRPGGGGGQAMGVRGPSFSRGPSTVKVTPGVDNSRARTLALLDYFMNEQGQPGALIQIAQQLQGLQDVPGGRKVTPGKLVRTGPNGQPQRQTSGSGSGSYSPKAFKGTATFDGKTVAAWIAPALRYARKHGWKGTVTSGFRSDAQQTAIYDSGVRPAARPRSEGGSGSNHEGSRYPLGAVDVSDAATLAKILQGSRYAGYLVWAGSKDPVHFSHPHGGGY